MKYEVRCGCGKTHAVSAADAGSSLPCSCGQTVDVPPLHALRTPGGEGAVSPLVRIRTALLNGRLPGTRACAVCRTETDGRCRVKVLCERTQNQSGPSQAELVGCLLIGLLFGVFMRTQRKNSTDEEAVIVPVPICETCRPKLADPNLLPFAVRSVPDYAALLDHYPQSQVTIVN